ncbi:MULTISPECIES: hypothetical protein [Sphingobium]|jgi:hypothetical protein|uniref:Glycerophosphoryl diester phosphodiesterase membrane domain-containing protein n=1 Tax=Sphingobium baderi TaxID=1332080 RepID=A0A0S3EXD2_9SPHN|nr:MULTISPECIES: hypothetical protein [Sphingobium]ALR20059.1 hypothetical protein ATN00_06795 [Sphingobium baderi]
MAALSIGKAWEDSLAFIKREGSLLFPVALLFLSVPMAILQLMIPPDYMRMAPGQTLASLPPLPGTVKIAMIVAGIVMLIGSLAVYALALRPGISVAEAIRLAIKRLPVILGASVLVGIALMFVLFGAAMIGGLLSVAIGKVGGLILAAALMLAAMLYVSARMLPLSALVIDHRQGVMAALRQTLSLTRGQAGRLGAFILVSMMLILVVQIAVQSIFGIVGTLILGQEGGRSVSDIAVALAAGAANVYLMVFTARIYRQLEGA